MLPPPKSGYLNTAFGRILLPEPSKLADLEVGWQHRKYGSVLDPTEAIAKPLMDVLLADDILRRVLDNDEEDNIAADLGYYDSQTEDDARPGLFDEEPDYTACDKECGYCGRCRY